MNSERIRKTFGSFGIDVLDCSRERRVSCLYSRENGLKTCRTYAEVQFLNPMPVELEREHALVLAGAAIGATFQSHGWHIVKRNTRVDTIALAANQSDIATAMRLDGRRTVALHAYVFEVQKGAQRCDYAHITELHHPDYLVAADVLAIYGPPAGAGQIRTPSATGSLPGKRA